MPTNDFTIEGFLEDRDLALASMDEARLRAYAAKYGIYAPDDETVFWAGVHKARLALGHLSDEQKEESRQWLESHGFRALG